MTAVRPLRLGEVRAHREGEQTAVFDPTTGTLSQLNSSALAIWELCDGKTEVGEMIDAVVELTGKSHIGVGAEIRVTLDQLERLGLIAKEG